MSALVLSLDQGSVDETTASLERAATVILEHVRAGMQEAMEGLAVAAVAAMGPAGIQSRTGELIENVEASPKVTETKDVIRGTVSAETGGNIHGQTFHIGLWMEEGTHVPAVTGADAKIFEFTEPDGQTFFTRGHIAFDVKPHPFMNPALRAYETVIDQILSDAVESAIEEI